MSSTAAQRPLWTPALTEQEAMRLLTPHEVVRDPVQHEIAITALERCIIDTASFQRLRGLLQLGPTHLVYPGAVHTRFVHSLGTLQCAHQLVQTANRNYEIYNQPTLCKVDSYPHLLVRLCALLHDVAHMPFGHTLEDEGNLASPEWDDSTRASHWLGDQGEIPTAIWEFLRQSGVDSERAQRVVSDVRQYILFRGDPMSLEYPFVIDFFGNTLCADLLDYLDRDMYFCGLRERSGDRMIRYVAVVKLRSESVDGKSKLTVDATSPNGRGRLVLLTYRFENEHGAGGRQRVVDQPDILSEAIDLLRRRFALAQKVFFHRTKIAASAMLISAAGSASFAIRDIYALSDAAFVARLIADSNPRTKYLADAYQGRRLFKQIYRLNYREESDTDPLSTKLWREQYPLYRDPLWRGEKEKQLESYAGLPPGSVAIYCPERTMNMKEFEMLVQSHPNGEVKPLHLILDGNRRLEMDALNRPYPYLWKLQVFVDPKALDACLVASEAVQNFSKLCEDLLGFPNDILELRGKGRPLREQVSEKVISNWQQEHEQQVPHDVFNELVNAAHRGQGADLADELSIHLQALMQTKKSRTDL